MDLDLTPPLMKELQEAIVDAFDDSSLERTVYFRLGKDLAEVAGIGVIANVVFRLINRAQQEGWQRPLVYAVAFDRPHNAKVAAFCAAHAPWTAAPPDAETLITRVAPDEELWDALLAAFDDNALEQMVKFNLGKDLFALVARGPLEAVAFKLITAARKQGWVRPLTYAVWRARPQNAKVVAYCTAHAPWAFSPPAADELIGQVTPGLGAANRRKADPGVRGVITRYGDDLKVTRDGTAALNKYKKLHDRLHALQVMFPQQFADLAEAARAGTLRAPLDLYVFQLRENARKARDEARGLRTQTLEDGWAELLDQTAALVGRPAPADAGSLERAGVLLRSVLGEAPRLNACLTDVATGLRLDKLADALGEIQEQVGGADADIGRARDGLVDLRPRLDGLTREHYEWQVLDRAFAIADVLPGHTLAERFPGWADVRRRLDNLFDLNRDKDWVAMLRRQIAEMEAAGPAGDNDRFERAFGTFRIVARDRFMDVDTELLDQSRSLAEIAPALNTLLS